MKSKDYFDHTFEGLHTSLGEITAEGTALKLLAGGIVPDNGLKTGDDGEYVNWFSGEPTVTLDGCFTVEKLTAIVWWMTHKGGV